MKKIGSMNADETGAVIGYMDLTDWECELGAALGGNRIFPSAKDCIENNSCAKACGVVEVEVRFRRVARKGKVGSV